MCCLNQSLVIHLCCLKKYSAKEITISLNAKITLSMSPSTCWVYDSIYKEPTAKMYDEEQWYLIKEKWIYIYIYMCVCVCVCVCLPNPSAWAGCNTGQFFDEVWPVWIQSFPFPKLVAVARLKSQSLPYYLLITGGKIIGFILFLRVLVLNEIQTAFSRFWTTFFV